MSENKKKLIYLSELEFSTLPALDVCIHHMSSLGVSAEAITFEIFGHVDTLELYYVQDAMITN